MLKGSVSTQIFETTKKFRTPTQLLNASNLQQKRVIGSDSVSGGRNHREAYVKERWKIPCVELKQKTMPGMLLLRTVFDSDWRFVRDQHMDGKVGSLP